MNVFRFGASAETSDAVVFLGRTVSLPCAAYLWFKTGPELIFAKRPPSGLIGSARNTCIR